MQLHRQVNSRFNSVTYWFIGHDVLWIVDPGDIDFLNTISANYNGCKVLLTHAHFDHIYGIEKVIERVPDAKIYTNGYGAQMLCNPKMNLSKYQDINIDLSVYKMNIAQVEDRESITGTPSVKAIFTPGHSDSCITWVVDDMVFCGDSYIPGVKTVTNLPGGDRQLAQESENLIKEISKGKFLCPGHAL